tara:strand:+ start:174 stop:1583 length:1410 start_codon:yes stop_codon:yes gene_type:complete
MWVAAALLVVVVGSVAFNFLTPWWFGEVASNWGSIDDTVLLTFWVCGVVFILVGLLLVFSVYKYRFRQGTRARYEPENTRLELWLTVGTTLGVVAMLGPGLFVWDEFIRVPAEASEMEVFGEQWRWRYRLPGRDGKLGTTDIGNISIRNPFGLNDDDPNGLDDVLIQSAEIHIPVNVPVKALLRSKDVLHDFFVPQFRVKMDLVPGIVTYFWFTPTRIGEFEILCAEYCGSSHYLMRGKVYVDSPKEYELWLQSQPTYAEMIAGFKPSSRDVTTGRNVAETNGCLACHSLDGGQVVGPTWQGLWGRSERLVDGSVVTVDEAYVRESIISPSVKIVDGFAPVMLSYDLPESDIQALLAFLRSTEGGAPGTVVKGPADVGQALVQSQGCLACHSLDGTKGVGPTWQGLWGRKEYLTDGSTVAVDAAYFRESIEYPNIKIVEGFAPVMLPYQFTDEEFEAMIAYAVERLAVP